MPSEALVVSAGWLAVELLALKRVFVSQLAGWLGVESLTLKRAFVLQLAGFPFAQPSSGLYTGRSALRSG
jgi:hypothetical protein